MTREEHIAEAKRLVGEIQAKSPEQLEFEDLLDRTEELGADWFDKIPTSDKIMADFTDRFFEPIKLTKFEFFYVEAMIGDAVICETHDRAEIALLKVWIWAAELYRPTKKAQDEKLES